MKTKEHLRELISSYASMVNKLDDMLNKIFIPWFKKRSVLFGDIQREERDLLHFIETELTSFLEKHKKEVKELLEEIGNI